MTMNNDKLLKMISSVIAVIFFSIAIFMLSKQLEGYSLNDIIRQILSVPSKRLVLAMMIMPCSYFVLTGYDYISLRYIGHRLKYYQIAFTSFLSYVFSLNIGLPAVTGGIVRFRYYVLWGLSVVEVAKLMVFITLTFFIGFFNLSSISFIWSDLSIPPDFPIHITNLKLLGIIFVGINLAYILITVPFHKGFTIGGLTYRPPKWNIVIGQFVIGTLDFLILGTLLYVVLPPIPINLITFLGMFLLTQMAGIISNVPGGIGVFETIMIFFLSQYSDTASILGSLIVYRIIYYVIPLVFAGILAVIFEFRQQIRDRII